MNQHLSDIARVGPCGLGTDALRSFIAEHCSSGLIESRRTAWRRDIDDLQSLYDVEANEVWKHVALHVPRFEKAEIEQDNPPDRLVALVTARLDKRQRSLPQFYENSSAAIFREGQWELHSDPDFLQCTDGRRLSYHFDLVDPEVAQFIESNLHYLQSTNRDAIHRYGLYIGDNRWPFAYVSLNHSDRDYKTSALGKALGFVVPETQCMNVSRIYGPGILPRNSVSAIIRLISKKLSIQDYRYLITAVNPLLGFTAASTIAAGFRPFALCPVAYCYDSHGRYVTRRNGGRYHARLATPPNLLFVRGICKGANKLVQAMESVVRVPLTLHSSIGRRDARSAKISSSVSLDEAFDEFRRDLEQAWDDMTRYHRTHFGENDPVSKGQCGVSSAYLASVLTRKNYKVKFCEGTANFPNGVEPIRNHCWIKIPQFEHGGRISRDLIVDLTADQTGGPEAVICDTDQSLRARGIVYQILHEVEPQEARKGHLSQRLEILSARLRNHSPAEE